MAHMARWGIFLDTEETDPIKIAKQAHQRVVNDPNATTWHITNLDTGEIYVVDIGTMEIIPAHVELD
ncbi:hypothetical protein ABW16_13730 [Mycolicibacter heraklionensis]|uniref:Uncharacterized protein n=1 Tax=Mycolicibacter heraklionensis TaxID=512402 RepID=A0ABR5FER8_9MYCO|nr:hypothetical protein [Mycolicibacter heraklionensis]KLO28350.1 hypothetical protein ABW16_13730 [Mycolicibacter heraklionensis]